MSVVGGAEGKCVGRRWWAGVLRGLGFGCELLPRASSRAENLSKVVTAMTAGRGAFIQRRRGAATPLPRPPPTHLLRVIAQPSITDSGQQPLACAAVSRLCSISTPEEVSHKHRAAAKNRPGPSGAPPNPSAAEFRTESILLKSCG